MSSQIAQQHLMWPKECNSKGVCHLYTHIALMVVVRREKTTSPGPMHKVYKSIQKFKSQVGMHKVYFLFNRQPRVLSNSESTRGFKFSPDPSIVNTVCMNSQRLPHGQLLIDKLF